EPGSMVYDGDFLVWQPYQGACMYGGVQPKAVSGDEWHFRSHEHKWPRGMARTLRFSLSLSDRSPRIARYVAPYWWYGATAELHAKPYLPVSDGLDKRLDEATIWCRNA